MADRAPFDESSERRRRVEALFADEPYLSPTMRARRLQDRTGRGEGGEYPSPPPPAFKPERPALRIETEPETARKPSSPSVEAGERISLLEARARLSRIPDGGREEPGEPSDAWTTRLRQFRVTVLERWKREMHP